MGGVEEKEKERGEEIKKKRKEEGEKKRYAHA